MNHLLLTILTFAAQRDDRPKPKPANPEWFTALGSLLGILVLGWLGWEFLAAFWDGLTTV